MPNTSIMGNRIATVRTLGGIDIVLGLWLIVSPFLLGYANLTTPLWNSIIIGVAVAALAATQTSREGYRRGWTGWVNVVLGIWLIFSPFILGFADVTSALWNNIILGIAITVLAAWSALYSAPNNTQV